MAKNQLTPEARRVKTIMITLPIMGAVACEDSRFSTKTRLLSTCCLLLVVLYKRLVLGEPRRTLPRNDPNAHGPLIPEPYHPGQPLRDERKQ